MVRTISKSLDAFGHCWRVRGLAAPRAGHRFEGVCDPCSAMFLKHSAKCASEDMM